MRVLVFAYHNIGYECVNVLLQWNEEIVGVVTHEDDKAEEIWFPSVAELARQHGLPVFTPVNPNTPQFIDQLRKLNPDLIFSFNYRKILSKEILRVPRLGGLNLHGSLLPRYRGRAPVNWVLVNGESETGVTLHHMIEKADAGDIVTQKRVPIEIDDTALSLYRKLTVAAAELLRETYPLLLEGKAPRIPQDPGLASKFGGRRPEDGRINWGSSALSVYNLVRAVTHPYPGAFTLLHGKRLFIWKAELTSQRSSAKQGDSGRVQAIEKGKGMVVSTGEGSLLVNRMQHEGFNEMPADEAAERHGLEVGTLLGS